MHHTWHMGLIALRYHLWYRWHRCLMATGDEAWRWYDEVVGGGRCPIVVSSPPPLSLSRHTTLHIKSFQGMPLVITGFIGCQGLSAGRQCKD